MKNLFLQNRTLENNTQFVWQNVEVPRLEEKGEKVDSVLDAKERAERDEIFAKNRKERMNLAKELSKNNNEGDPATVFEEWPKEEKHTNTSENSKSSLEQGEDPITSAAGKFWHKLFPEKKEDFHSSDMEKIHTNDSKAIQKPNTTKVDNEKTETEKETNKNTKEVDPITKLLGKTKADEGAGYKSTDQVEAEIVQEENQGGEIAGLNISTRANDENFVDAKLDSDAEKNSSDYTA